MWSPPFIALPFDSGWENVLEAQRQFDMRFATGMFPWHLIHMRPCVAHLICQGKQVQAILSNEEAKKLILKRSVFELVKNTQFLELTDSKLLGWYLCLPAEDRKLIQEEGGLLQFLQKHPALDVTRNFVYVTRQSLEEFTYPLSSAMSTDLDKSRQPIICGVSLCKNCRASIPFNTKACKLCCVHTQNPDEKLCLQDHGKELGLLPTSVKEELNFGALRVRDSPAERQTAQNSADESLNLMTEESFCSACEGTTAATPTGHQGAQCSQAHILSQLWDEQVESKSSVVTMYKDLSGQASFALDAHLERHSKMPPTVVGGQEQGRYRGDGTADLPEAEIIPEYCSLDNTGLGTSYRDCCENSHSGGSFNSEPLQVHESHVARQADGCSSPGSAPCCGRCTEWKPSNAVDDYNEEEESSCGLKNEEFHSLMEEESPEISGAAWVNSRSPTGQSAEMDTQLNPSAEHNFVCSPTDTSGSFSSTAAMYDSTSVVESPQFAMSQSVDVSRDFRDSYTSTRATEAKSSTASKFSNTELSFTTRNAAVNTGCPVPLQDRGIQTVSVSTAEKCVITEVYMADLDCFIEEFDKLQHAQDELDELKAKLLCPDGEESDGSGREGHACDCSQRAVRAELRLLALQYAMCQQHCWRRYYTSPEGELSILSMEAPTENIKSLLLDLEKDYRKMKEKVLSGVPLDRLCALSVNSQRTGTDAVYIPSQIVKDSLSEEEASGTGLGAHEQLGPQDGRESDGGDSIGQSCAEPMQSDAPPAVKPRLECEGADGLRPQQTAPSTDAAAGPKPGGAKDLETSEAWYDAEEELGSVAKGPKGTQNDAVEEGSAGAVSKGKKDLNCLLCVSGLPNHITEEEVRFHFRKYQVSEVNITTFSSDIRVAMMTVSCLKMADAAVREMNRGTVMGHAVKVTLVGGPGNLLLEGPRGQKAKPYSRCNPKAESAENTKGLNNSKICLSITAKPIQRRLEKLTNVQDTPTPTGTCVPRHYATMGSFQTLMARLMERHPEAGRERIIRALVDLREQKQNLCGLPLKDIVEMTSDLLTRSAP